MNVCSLTGFKLLAKNLPPLKATLYDTEHQLAINSCKRIIKAAKKVYPHQVAEAEEIEWINGVAIYNKKLFY